ncbi:hypothetical protein VQ643_02555 [Pseudomonas sp. F1_0610]|uniref:hypothetical protein n=1 Tax=Pseudomonas sp. F1_0610 TaxID=3114284 RepID=UPI0039C3ADD4
MPTKAKTIVKNSTDSGTVFVISLIIGCALSGILYWVKQQYSFEQISAVAYIAFLAQILLYAWLGLFLFYKYTINYYVFSAVIGCELLFKALYSFGWLTPMLSSLLFTSVLAGASWLFNKKQKTSLAIVLSIIFQLLLVRDCIFSYASHPSWLFLMESIILSSVLIWRLKVPIESGDNIRAV